jgi:hypothetical protein
MPASFLASIGPVQTPTTIRSLAKSAEACRNPEESKIQSQLSGGGTKIYICLWQHLEKAAVAVMEAVEGAAEDHRTIRRRSRLLLLVSSRRRSSRCVAGIDHFTPLSLSLFSLCGRRRLCGYGFLFCSEMQRAQIYWHPIDDRGTDISIMMTTHRAESIHARSPLTPADSLTD